MNTLAAVLVVLALTLNTSSHASDIEWIAELNSGSVYGVITSGETKPWKNKHNVVFAQVVRLDTKTGNGNVKGTRWISEFVINCESQMYQVGVIGVIRGGKIMSDYSDSYIKYLEKPLVSVERDTVAATVVDFACTFVGSYEEEKQPSRGSSSVYVPL